MNDPQAKLEHIIFLVREYEQTLSNQHQEFYSRCNTISLLNELTMSCSDCLTEAPTLIPQPSIEPQAQVYLERIEAFLSIKETP